MRRTKRILRTHILERGQPPALLQSSRSLAPSVPWGQEKRGQTSFPMMQPATRGPLALGHLFSPASLRWPCCYQGAWGPVLQEVPLNLPADQIPDVGASPAAPSPSLAPGSHPAIRQFSWEMSAPLSSSSTQPHNLAWQIGGVRPLTVDWAASCLSPGFFSSCPKGTLSRSGCPLPEQTRPLGSSPCGSPTPSSRRLLENLTANHTAHL